MFDYKVPEVIKQIIRIPGSRGGFRVVLDGKCGNVECAQTLDHVVVQTEMTHFNRAKARG